MVDSSWFVVNDCELIDTSYLGIAKTVCLNEQLRYFSIFITF
ncbi:MAG: hypothetical protein ABH862_00075 [Candidatus Omnitrophota bacterium]